MQTLTKELTIFKNEWPFFPFSEIKLLDKYERWRRVAKILKVSRDAQRRLNWIIYYYEKADRNASLVCRHFSIAPKTFYKWFKLFDENNLYTLNLLQDRSKAPKRVRQREITAEQKLRIIKLRKKHIRYGKIKLAIIYQTEYGESISSWKIQKVIEDNKLYFNPLKTARIAKKKARTKEKGAKKRTIELIKNLPDYQKTSGYIICLDTITIYWNGIKRYIFTAIDKYGKFAYARSYKSKSSKNGEDFLYRLHYLLDGQIPRVGHDNGTEFEKCFRAACKKLKIEQYYSRVRTPKDNPDNERFNQTLETEFLDLGNMRFDLNELNCNLTEWLIEYNFKRPHQSLNYQTPIEFSKVLPMYSSCTGYCNFKLLC
jgi:transposase InsO family protein/transposase-like protein